MTHNNQRDMKPEAQNARAKDSVSPDQRNDRNNNFDDKAHMSPNVGKANLQNERRNLQADQEKRPSEHNPEHGNRKV